MTASREAQARIDAHFDDSTAFWTEIYSAADVYGVIHQYRRALALEWIDELGLSAGAKVLEVGCGTGLTAVALARRDLDVVATDAAPGMIEAARGNADRANVGPRVLTRRADVQALDFPDGAFDLVVALGVVPFLTSPQDALGEIERVIRPGGAFVGNADNDVRLTRLVDPRTNPRLAGARLWVKRRLGLRLSDRPAQIAVSRQTTGEFDRLLAAAGLAPVKGRTFGFGPFTLFGREVIRGRPAVWLHRALQWLADHGVRGLRSTGAQYLVVARKRSEPASAPR